jgi:hypothetical protein
MPMASLSGLFAATISLAAYILIIGSGSAVAQGASPPPAVSVVAVASRQVTETASFVGRVVAIDKVDVVARVSGFINERNFTEGQQVKTGDLLFRIEPDTYKAAVDQQTANLARAKATEVNANLQLQRGQDLVRNQNIPQSEVDQRAANAQAAHADVLQTQALLEQAKINLGYTEIRSPIDDLRISHYGQSCQPIIRHLTIVAKVAMIARPLLAAIPGAIAFPFNLPPIIGLGNTGGFQFALEALQGQSPNDLAAVLRGLLVTANGQPELAGVFSTYAADTPQIYLDIDRDKAQVLGIRISDIFNALQSTLGSYYVNDFNVFGRTWQVNLQAETTRRSDRANLCAQCPRQHGAVARYRQS